MRRAAAECPAKTFATLEDHTCDRTAQTGGKALLSSSQPERLLRPPWHTRLSSSFPLRSLPPSSRLLAGWPGSHEFTSLDGKVDDHASMPEHQCLSEDVWVEHWTLTSS